MLQVSRVEGGGGGVLEEPGLEEMEVMGLHGGTALQSGYSQNRLL